MDSKDDSLYGDIDVIGDSVEVEHLRHELKDARIIIAAKDKEIADLIAQNKYLYDGRAALEKNLVSLYNTALSEIKRKDREIAELRNSLLSTKRIVAPEDPVSSLGSSSSTRDIK